LSRAPAFFALVSAAARLPYTYDPDCPLLTEKQLAEFCPVNFGSMEERARHMEVAGAMAPETVSAPASGVALSV